jgi:hypothetical protein
MNSLMAKAQITTPKGTKVMIEGTSDEVAALIRHLDGTEHGRSNAHPPATKTTRQSSPRKGKAGPMVLISELLDGGYFKTPKGLGDIKTTLEEQGHFYPVTTLSPVVLRMVKKRDLRRVKDGSRWVYVG